MYYLYTKSNCVWCIRLKEYLTELGVDFYQVNVDEPSNRQELLDMYPEVKTVPQLFDVQELVENVPTKFTHIGGYDQSKEYFSARQQK